jgi:hypothetical protein
MLLWLILIGGLPVLGGYFLLRGKVKSMDRLKKQVEGDVSSRLASIAQAVGGTLVEGPSLEMPRGRMSLVASKAPESMVIDLAKFTAKTALAGTMTVVRIEDVKKVIATKHLRPLLGHPFSEKYHALVSDEEQGRRWLSAEFVGKLSALEGAVRARCRVQVANGTATVLAFRGLAKVEELKSFCDGSIAVVEALDASSRPSA